MKSDPMFTGWDNFYFLIGSAAGGLIGLLFVVVTLTAGFERSHALRGASLYMTPTAVHFAAVLCMSAVALAPGLPTSATAAIFGLIGLVGFANAVRACVGITTYSPAAGPPLWSDVWMYGVVPATIYLGLCAASLAIGARAEWAPHGLAALLLILLLAGIRNAWDLVTWIAPMRKSDSA
jgi:lysylphosphatidylglycerol synthetase-like protein (DUF2156 family)